MATIDYKQKIKDYMNSSEVDTLYKSMLNNLFPELKESVDEVVRKQLLEMVHDTTGDSLWVDYNIHKEDAIAWLEKQGNKDEEILVLKDQIESLHAAIKAIKETHRIEIEKQGEQKPADKVSLDFKKGDILYEQKTMSILLVYERNGSWLMTFCDYWMLKEKLHIEFPYENYGFVQEMSLVPATKEQRDLLFQKMREAGYKWDTEKKELKKIEQKHADTGKGANGNEREIPIPEPPLTIKHAKEVMGIKQNDAWSEEEEEIHRKCICAMRAYAYGFPEEEKFVEQVDNWLKSLKERYTWKPSDEQLECLGYAIEKAEKDWSPLTNNRIYLTLKALKEQLLELRGSKV